MNASAFVWPPLTCLRWGVFISCFFHHSVHSVLTSIHSSAMYIHIILFTSITIFRHKMPRFTDETTGFEFMINKGVLPEEMWVSTFHNWVLTLSTFSKLTDIALTVEHPWITRGFSKHYEQRNKFGSIFVLTRLITNYEPTLMCDTLFYNTLPGSQRVTKDRQKKKS